MHLKSLTLKGFKSFASATTLRLEPGITCVVGPNGSGKSNVVDAISWVLGEQGAKALRGGKMEDVIFAGTSGRAPLGRAEVTLTIDNADGALPIDYAEVSITRRMFRDGAGEYEINGSHCRLLDIQELLSDSGIGREMHVIVGQGQLDSVLSSKPEDRRAYIEEAAGVLKHRKRKEKALRKLDAMQANLTRLTDLTAELRRQLKPLGRQAEIARRAQAVQSELRDARLRLAADDLVTLRDELAKEEADEASARARRAEVEAQLSAGRVEQERLEAALAEDAPRLAAAQDTWYRLSALAERLAGTVRLAQERARHLAGAAEARAPGRDPDELDAEADAIAEQEEALVAAVVEARRALSEITEARTEHERTLAAAERAHLAAVRALADRRAGLATLAGRAEALRSGAAATAEEIERLSDALAEAQERTAAAEAELAGAREELGALAEGDTSLEERGTHTAAAHEAARGRVAELVAQEREAEQQRAHWRARVEALSVGLARRDGSASIVGAEGVLGTVSALVAVEAEARTAVAAALGELADGLAVADLDAAVAALATLRTGGAGRASLVVATPADVTPPLDRWRRRRPPRRRIGARPRCRGARRAAGAGATAGRAPAPARAWCGADHAPLPRGVPGAPGRQRRCPGKGRSRRRCGRCCRAWCSSPTGRRRGGWSRPGSPPSPPMGTSSARTGRPAAPGAAAAHSTSRPPSTTPRPPSRRWRSRSPGCGPRSTAPGPRRRRARPTSRRRSANRPPPSSAARAPRPRARRPRAGRAVRHGRGRAPAHPPRRGRDPSHRRPARTGGRGAAARGGRGRTGGRRARHRDPRRRRRGRRDRPIGGGRRPPGVAHCRGTGAGDRGPGRILAPSGRRRTPGPQPSGRRPRGPGARRPHRRAGRHGGGDGVRADRRVARGRRRAGRRRGRPRLPRA